MVGLYQPLRLKVTYSATSVCHNTDCSSVRYPGDDSMPSRKAHIAVVAADGNVSSLCKTSLPAPASLATSSFDTTSKKTTKSREFQALRFNEG